MICSTQRDIKYQINIGLRISGCIVDCSVHAAGVKIDRKGAYVMIWFISDCMYIKQSGENPPLLYFWIFSKVYRTVLHYFLKLDSATTTTTNFFIGLQHCRCLL